MSGGINEVDFNWQQRFDFTSSQARLLNSFDVVCLIANRNIATGIFAQPTAVLQHAGSSGLALVLWVLGGILMLCLAWVWTEFALTIPSHAVLFQDGVWRLTPTPRAGGDKNYLEWIYKRPRLLITCIFGVAFIIFGNLAQNALQLGYYLAAARSPGCTSGDCADQHKAEIIGWAIGSITVTALINVSTRRFAIGLNNALASIKVLFLVGVALLGIVWGTMHGNGCAEISFVNRGGTGGFGDIVQGLVFAIFPYSGYEQPFYVLSEVASPRQHFAKAVTAAMATLLLLFPLVNVGYLCVVPYSGNGSLPTTMIATMFERVLAGDGQPAANNGVLRGVYVVLAIFILGNLLAQTYTGSRVKQEIAKEGVLPKPLFFSSSNDTLFARFGSSSASRQSRWPNIDALGHVVDQVPMAATMLHWSVETVLVLAIGITFPIETAYKVLTFLQTFVIVILLGLLVSNGLLYLKIADYVSWGKRPEGRSWRLLSRWKPWLDPLPAVVAGASLTFLAGAVFAPPSLQIRNILGVPWWVPPLIGLSCLVLGGLWWLGILFLERCRHERLSTSRETHVGFGPDGEPRVLVESVRCAWVPDPPRRRRGRA